MKRKWVCGDKGESDYGGELVMGLDLRREGAGTVIATLDSIELN